MHDWAGRSDSQKCTEGPLAWKRGLRELKMSQQQSLKKSVNYPSHLSLAFLQARKY